MIIAFLINTSDPIIFTNPDIFTQNADLIYFGYHFFCFALGCIHAAYFHLIGKIHMENLGFIRTQIQIPFIMLIRADTMDASMRNIFATVKIDDPIIFDTENASVIGQTINNISHSADQPIHIGIIQLAVLYGTKFQFRVNHIKSVGRCHINITGTVFRDGSDGRRSKSFFLIEERKLSFVHHRYTAVVGTDPKPVLTIHEQSNNTGKSVGRIKTGKSITVISYQTTIAGDPNKAIRRLDYCIRLRSRQAVGIVV